MNKYPSMPRQLVARWRLSEQSHPPGQQVAFHYHDAEEWLEVLEGKISFFSAGEVEYPLVKGEALEIPQGEIHRVAIGPEGVMYQMWVPVYDEPFSHRFDDDMSLIRGNLELPEVENRWDTRNGEVLTAGDNENRAFLDDFLSTDLTFCTAAGKLLVGKMAYLDRPPANVIRYPSDSIRILHKGPESILLSTVVYTEPKNGGPRKSFSNSRFFVKEGGIWKCRVWIKYPASSLDIRHPGAEAHAKRLQAELTTTTQQMVALKESYERDKQQVAKLEQELIITRRQSTDLESTLQRAEAQITQLQSVVATRGQRIFIGHGRSPLWRELKDFIAERLRLPWEEFNREAVAGYTTAERLESMLSQAAFAFLIMTAEEEREDTTLHARPNVIHEVGLFQGHLGLRHAIVMVEEGCSEFSNIIGLSQIRFPRGDISARFEEVRRVLEREKLLV